MKRTLGIFFKLISISAISFFISNYSLCANSLVFQNQLIEAEIEEEKENDSFVLSIESEFDFIGSGTDVFVSQKVKSVSCFVVYLPKQPQFFGDKFSSCEHLPLYLLNCALIIYS